LRKKKGVLKKKEPNSRRISEKVTGDEKNREPFGTGPDQQSPIVKSKETERLEEEVTDSRKDNCLIIK